MQILRYDKSHSICNFIKNLNDISELKIDNTYLTLSGFRREFYEDEERDFSFYADANYAENNFQQLYALTYTPHDQIHDFFEKIYLFQFKRNYATTINEIKIMILKAFSWQGNGMPNLQAHRGTFNFDKKDLKFIDAITNKLESIMKQEIPCENCSFGALYKLKQKCSYLYRDKKLDELFYETGSSTK